MWSLLRRWCNKPANNTRAGCNGAARAAAESMARKAAADRMTPIYERLAPVLHELPPDEFTDRIIRAFGRRP